MLQRIKFIFYVSLFFSGNDQNLKQISNCLKINNYSDKEIKQKENLFNPKHRIKLQKNNYKEIILSNINSKFIKIYNNPFIYKAFYYSFPYLLKQNVLQSDNDFFKEFIKFLKYIYF